MLQQSVYNVAKAQAIGLKEAISMQILPTSSSLIGSLINKSYVSAVDNPDVAVEIEQVTGDTSSMISAHTAAVGAIADELGPVVQAHIAYIQNTVSPKVTEMTEKLAEFIDIGSQAGPSSLFDIQITTPPPTVTNEGLKAMMERYAQDGQVEPSRLTQLPALSYEDILGLTAVSQTAANDEIQAWLAEKGQEWLMNIWAYYFASQNAVMAPMARGMGYVDGLGGLPKLATLNRAEVATAIFLISRNLFDGALEGDVGMSLSAWRTATDAYSRFAASQVKGTIKMIETYGRNNMIVLSVSQDGKTAVVYGPTYNAWLSEGKSVETVLGALVSNKARSYSRADLDDVTVDFAGQWNSYAKLQEATLRAALNSSIRSQALGMFRGMLYKFDDNETNMLGDTNDLFEGMVKKAREWLGTLPGNKVLCPETIALNLVARIRYSHTPAYQFLGDMYEMQANGCDDPREAAMVAGINYLADFLSVQLALTKV